MSAQAAVDLDGFFKAVGLALEIHRKQSRIPNDLQPIYTESFPKERLLKTDDPFDVITFSVGASGMADGSNSGTGKQIPRTIISDVDLGGYKVAKLQWQEQAHVVFEIWSRSNTSANALVTWFHRFMMRYGYQVKFYRPRGIDLFRFIGRMKDERESKEDQELYVRRLVYEIRLNYVDAFLDKTLESVDVNLSAGGEVESVTISAQ
jgi:hypothetical protein